MTGMRESTPWREASPGVCERLHNGDLWSLRYRTERGMWERYGPHPVRLKWVDAAPGLRTAQQVTDDLIQRYYGETVDNSVTDVVPRGMDHRSALGLMRDVRRQAQTARVMIEGRCNPYDQEAILMVEALGMVLGMLHRWRPS